MEQTEGRRARREARWSAEQPAPGSVVGRMSALSDWQHLTKQERQWASDALSAPSQGALATLWGLSVKGVKTRLVRLRKKIHDLEKE